MDKGPDNVTQTTTSEPPAYLLPHLRNAANYSGQLFQQGAQQFYPGNTVVPFSPQTNQALNLQQNRAMSGSGVVDAAQGLTQSTLEGDFLNANPYLDATFDRAAGAVNRSLDTANARSGRDVNANMGARASQLNDLATNIYGGNYQAERDRQAASVGSAIPLAREDYFDIGQLGQVGSAVEQQTGNIINDRVNRFNFAQGAPGAALDQYIARLMGQNAGGTTSSTQPVFNNNLSSGIGGALAGTSMFGPWGALLGLPGLLGL